MKRTALRASGRCTNGDALVGLLLLSLITAGLSACDSTASIGAPSIKFERIQLVSAAARVDRNGEVARQCQVQPDDVVTGLEFAFVLKHTSPDVKKGSAGPTCDGAPERDWSIRPGDRIERRQIIIGENITPTSFELNADCVEPYPDPDIISNRVCQGVDNPDFDPEGLDFRNFYEWSGDVGDLPVRCEPAAVIMLLDMSGSVRGLVNEQNGYREGTPGDFQPPTDFRRVATDPTNSRLAAAVTFIEDLNANDQIVVMSFQERPGAENLKVLCSVDPPPAEGDLANDPEYVRHAIECFGFNREILVDPVRQSFGSESGRTPLWDAVYRAYQLLNRDELEAPRNRHIVVVTDGPDTCNDGSVDFHQAGGAQCSATSYEEVYDLITEENAKPGASPVHVHFVQLQARGYPHRDARQMELACATHGLYQFVNGENFTRTTSGNPPTEYGDALTEALTRVRYSLSGYWTLDANSAAFDVAATSPGYLKPGTLYGVSGALTLKASDYLKEPKVQPFDARGEDQWGAWDLRVAFRRMCLDDSQCTTGAPDACKVYCSPQDAVCLVDGEGRPAPADLPDGTTCTTGTGEAGQCCTGACQAGACP